MWKDENGYVYTEEDLFNIALEECLSEESAYDYIKIKKGRINYLRVLN